MMLANKQLGAKCSRAKSSAASRKATVVVRAADAPLAKVERGKDVLYVGADSASIKYLDGTLPGDYGFDPLGLLDPVNSVGFINPAWLQYSEVIHCRWAMLGAAGCIGPEALSAMGLIPAETGVVWFRSGVIPPAGQYSYWTDSFSLFFLEVVLMQFAELKRLQDFRNPGSQSQQYFVGLEGFFKGSGNPAYPGGPVFNFMGLGKTEAELTKLKKNEIENGRLAMLAMLGYGAQAVITSKGPLANLGDHLSNPTGKNILTSFGTVLSGQ